MERSRLELAVMVFPNFNENFAAVDDLENVEALPSFQEVETQRWGKQSAIARGPGSMKAANQEVAVAWNSFLPSLGMDYFYGIDANHYASKRASILLQGSRARTWDTLQLPRCDLPLWNWGAGRSKVKAADLQRDQARWN